MNVELKPIKPQRISDQVYEQIRELIFRGRLAPGEQLMPERELAEALTVSRTTVRNAISKLVAIGLLEHRQGQGTFVRSSETRHRDNPLAAAIDDQETTLLDLLEVRLALECSGAALAAQRAEKNDLDHMTRSLEEMEKAALSNRPTVAAETSFHMAVAFATKNPFYVNIMKNFFDLLFARIQNKLVHFYQDQQSHEAIMDQYRSIYDAVSRQDSHAARTAMMQHINFVIDLFHE